MPRSTEWGDKYVTGIAIIDSQHRQIFDYLSEIDEAIALRSTSAIEDVVIGLLDYAVSHNAFEEQLMQEAGYPHFDGHHDAHCAFKRRTEDYVRRLSSGENPVHLARQIRNDISLWIKGHILHEDMAYVPWMIRRQPEQGMVNRLVARFFPKRPIPLYAG